jgi:ankyrin repeat protein
VLDLLLAAGADPNITSNDGLTAFIAAKKSKHPEVADVLEPIRKPPAD